MRFGGPPGVRIGASDPIIEQRPIVPQFGSTCADERLLLADGRAARFGAERPCLSGLVLASVLLVGAAAVATVLVMSWASGVGSPEGSAAPVAGEIMFLGWNLLPHAWALGLAKTASRPPGGASAMVVAAGSLVLAVVDASFLRSFVASESSTSALIFLTLPLILGVIVGVVHSTVLLLRGRSESAMRSKLGSVRCKTAGSVALWGTEPLLAKSRSGTPPRVRSGARAVWECPGTFRREPDRSHSLS